MPDTIPITAGSGTTVGTDEVTIGGTLQHVQRVKLVDGADGGTALIGGDATNGLDVDVTRLPALVAGTANIGDVDVLTMPTTTVTGTVAHDGIDSGNPQKIGGIADDTLPTAVGDLDRVNAWFDRHGRQHVRTGNQSAAPNVWTAIHVPAANVQATISKAAAGIGVRNVVTALTAVIAATATAPTAVNVTVNLIDGASAGTTFLWRTTLSLPATAGETRGVTISGLWLPGTANTATTLEMSAAGGANTIESVSMSGITITE